VVWRTITEPDQYEPVVRRPGGPRGRTERSWLHAVGDQGALSSWRRSTRRLLLIPLDHPRGEEPVTGNSMLVEFTLTPEGDERTRLRVSESGHELLARPGAGSNDYADEHRGGWGVTWTASPACSRSAT